MMKRFRALRKISERSESDVDNSNGVTTEQSDKTTSTINKLEDLKGLKEGKRKEDLKEEEGKEMNNEENDQKASNENSNKILLRSSVFENIKRASVKFTEKQKSTFIDTKNNIASHLSFFHKDVSKSDKASCSYTPMDGVVKPSKSIEVINEQPSLTKRISIKDYSDRGYYIITNEKSGFKSLNDSDEGTDEHFYEDLVQINIGNDEKQTQAVDSGKKPTGKLKGMISSLKFKKLSIFKKDGISKLETVQCENDDQADKNKEEDQPKINDTNYLYVNDKNLENMYDVVKPPRRVEPVQEEAPSTAEHYAEPVSSCRRESDYCDIVEDGDKTPSCLNWIFTKRTTDPSLNSSTDDIQPVTTSGAVKKLIDEKTNMAARPLPVPIENEPFYMSVDRCGAEVMLTGQPNGTFLLRPSSQPNHAYTLSVVCDDVIHNVGVRRRADGSLALGYARRGQRTFSSVASLLAHHRRRRLRLLAGGRSLGATCLREPPAHYQVPRPRVEHV